MKVKVSPLISWKQIKALNQEYNEQIIRAKREGIPIVLHTAYFPPELIQAFDVVGVPGEWYGSICGNMRDVGLLEAAEHSGYPREVCSIHECASAQC